MRHIPGRSLASSDPARLNLLRFSCAKFREVVDLGTMKIGSKFAGLAVLLAVVGTPTLSCFVPRHLLKAAEHACCRDIGDRCGSKTMPSPQSCCKTGSHGDQPYMTAGAQRQLAPAPGLTANVPAMDTPTVLAIHSSPCVSFSFAHSPPGTPSETVSILRI